MPHLPLAEASVKNAIDLKANGEVSRMRSHKGNMPSLPQTKYCALCPAKFTRTTHLNRHLRSHTNERAHRCNVCNAEFTRSDLLTRHKRTCGDSSNANRSRRKSCQACAESKVKCNLQQPCSKCEARGRECIFINDPEASRNRKIAKKVTHSSLSLSPSETEFSESPTGLSSLGSSSPTSTFSVTSRGRGNHSNLASSSHPHNQLLAAPSFGLSGVSSPSDCSSSVCSSRSSPQLDFFDPHQLSNSLSVNFNTLGLDSELSDYFSNAIDPFPEDPFSPCLPRAQSEAAWFETNRSCAGYGSNEPNLYSQPHCQTSDQDFFSGLTNLNRIPSSSGKTSFSRQHFSTFLPMGQSTAPLTPSSASRNPTTEELNHYLYLFFTEFSIQIPLFHRPTWKMESTHPILVSAMQACGALLVKTPTAMEFIIKTLTSSRDTLIVEFSKPSCTLKDHMGLMLAVVLLQSIVTFQPRPDQRMLSKLYHEVLVMMIRKTGLIKLIASWPLPDLSNPHVLDSAWKDWAWYETCKRALVLAFVQDCSNCMYYSAHPAFLPSEFEINLPCDDALWRAQTAREWYQMQSMPSTYGTRSARMLGTSMQMALAALKEPTSSVIPFIVNPFSAFVLVHSILRDVFSLPQGPGIHHACIGNSRMAVGANILTIQCALHNWQRMWSSSPEAVHFEQQGQASPFAYNAIPFYWLARYAEGAKQNGVFPTSPRGAQLSRSDVEDRYRTVKGWLNQINATLRSGSQILPHPTGAAVLTSFSHAPP
ncbi:fungal-specific transcription factor domain-containing protein [Flammula alnicola]|nr:fungal-specific transcription factor domain-containing protein [Flammula alnicola]